MKKFGVGIIGCGAIFGVHAFPLHTIENVEVKAVCDIKPAAREAAARLFNCDMYEDYREMLKRDDIDVVHVMTPHYLHAQMVVDAANAGKHVLTEKPMSITREDACAEIEAGKRNNVTIGVISQNRYNSASVAIKEAIDSGSLGKVVGVRVILSWFKPNEYYQNSDWHGTWDKEGGSLIIDQSIHVLDLARWFVNDEITSVEATIDNRNHPVIETEDTAEGLIKYRNGVQTVFYATNNFTYNSDVMVEIHCEKGNALMQFDRAVITYRDGREINVINNPNDTLDEAAYQAFFNMSSSQAAFQTLSTWGVFGEPVSIPITWKTPRPYWGITHIKQIKNYYESLTAGVQPDITAEEAFKTMEMICAIYQSAKTHQKVILHYGSLEVRRNSMGASLQLIENNSLRAREDGYEILVRLNWYRSLPLSCVDSLRMSLDGEPVPPEQIFFEINEHQYRLDELPELAEEFWFVQDSARLHVTQPGKVKAGETHQVEAEIAMRFPYIAIGPGKFLTTPTRCTLTQTAK